MIEYIEFYSHLCPPAICSEIGDPWHSIGWEKFLALTPGDVFWVTTPLCKVTRCLGLSWTGPIISELNTVEYFV